jgi:hypothetical protein
MAEYLSCSDAVVDDAGEHRHDELASDGGVDVPLLPKPVILWGAGWGVTGSAGRRRTTFGDVGQRRLIRACLCFGCSGAWVVHAHTGELHRTASNGAEQHVYTVQQRRGDVTSLLELLP